MVRFVKVLGLVALAGVSGNACAMTSGAPETPHCRVVDPGKLPAESGGASALCSAIERAITARASGAAFSAEVRVLSSSRLAATVTANGKALPEQNFATMDRDLNRASFERFAAALAEQVAKATR
ncbi:MAG TPA: hypothetical protein VIZ66_02515 [Sphingomicrobium sp.]